MPSTSNITRIVHSSYHDMYNTIIITNHTNDDEIAAGPWGNIL